MSELYRYSNDFNPISGVPKNITDILPVPDAPASSNILINGVHIYTGTNEANTINATTTGTNRVFATQGNDSITTGGNQWTTNYIYGGKGDDTITSGAGTDIIYGGGGKNTIYLSKGSGNDITYDVKAYEGEQTIDNSATTTNNIVLLTSEDDDNSSVISNNKYNYTYLPKIV